MQAAEAKRTCVPSVLSRFCLTCVFMPASIDSHCCTSAACSDRSGRQCETQWGTAGGAADGGGLLGRPLEDEAPLEPSTCTIILVTVVST